MGVTLVSHSTSRTRFHPSTLRAIDHARAGNSLGPAVRHFPALLTAEEIVALPGAPMRVFPQRDIAPHYDFDGKLYPPCAGGFLWIFGITDEESDLSSFGFGLSADEAVRDALTSMYDVSD